MKLYDLLNGVKFALIKGRNEEVENITIDSRTVAKNLLFVCASAFSVDRHDFIGDAIKNGATAVIVEKDVEIYEDITVIRVENAREALSYIAMNFYGNNHKNMNMIGVTGTNGKTSITYFLEAILQEAGIKNGVIGTTGARIGEETLDINIATSTTPDSLELHQILKAMYEKGVKAVIMEVTSHALELKKLDGVIFDHAIFTNLTQDHLDLHGTMENYANAKAKLFAQSNSSVLNLDDEYYNYMAEKAMGKIKTYSIEKSSDFRALDVKYSASSIEFLVNSHEFKIPIAGRFTVYNSLAVIATAFNLGIDAEIVKSALSKLKGVPGRIQSVKNTREINIIVDYAHTPDGLKNIIEAVREFTAGKVITVFGCGGDRDATKRPIMGEISAELSDFTIITSDNPRSENPENILSDVEVGISPITSNYIKIVDRREAIEKAISMAKKGDSIIIAGKGHENYQIFANETVHFDDVEVSIEALNRGYKMRSLKLSKIAEAVSGILHANDGNLEINSVAIDTRKDCINSLFVPIKGTNFDAHDFIDLAFEKGAVCVLSERMLNTNKPYILVKSTNYALLELAKYYKSLFNVKVIGITGSSGKTTTKDMIAAVLAEKYNVVKTEGNYNNEIGLPLTVFRTTAETEVLVLEMGMNNFGEISRLSMVGEPDICVITNIGTSHIDNLGSREGIFQAKSEIFEYMKKDGVAILNADCDKLITLSDKEFAKHYISLENYIDCFGYDLQNIGSEGLSFKVDFSGEIYEVNLNYPGRFMVYNAMNAIVCGKLLGLSKEEIEKGLSKFISSKDRMKIQTSKAGIKVINDVYNANPHSMTEALTMLSEFNGQKAAIIGDMFGLGEHSERLHIEVAEKLATLSINKIICIGKYAKLMYNFLVEADKSGVYYFETKEEFIENGLNLLQSMNTVLVKASRGMEFEKIVEVLG